MQKHVFESLYKIFLIRHKLAPIVAQQSLWEGKTNLINIPVQTTFGVLLGKPVQLENICRNTKYISAVNFV